MLCGHRKSFCNRRIPPLIYSTAETLSVLPAQHSRVNRQRGFKVQEKNMAQAIANVFGATSTTDEVLDGVDLRGKRVLVTGVSAGLGVETARSLVAHGAQVVGAARDLVKA